MAEPGALLILVYTGEVRKRVECKCEVVEGRANLVGGKCGTGTSKGGRRCATRKRRAQGEALPHKKDCPTAEESRGLSTQQAWPPAPRRRHTLMRMQAAYDIAGARAREREIKVKRFMA